MYFNSDNECETIQKVLRFDMLFSRFIIRDWFSANEECNIYSKHNKIIIKSCVKHHWKYWENRNEILHKPKIRIARTID